MDFKELSPAFLTSLAAIFVGAIMASASSTVVTVLGWLLILGGIGLNVFSALISIQQAKGGALPFLNQHEIEDGETVEEADLVEDSEPDTESHPIVIHDEKPASDEAIFRSARKKTTLNKR